jgi:hypothetical protein
MVARDRTLISIAVDLSRLPDDPIAEDHLSDILLVGREVDLLETIRVSSKDTTILLSF